MTSVASAEQGWEVHPTTDGTPGRWKLHFPRVPYLHNTHYASIRHARAAVGKYLEEEAARREAADPLEEAEAALRGCITAEQWEQVRPHWEKIAEVWEEMR